MALSKYKSPSNGTFVFIIRSQSIKTCQFAKINLILAKI